jgi:hypothetical protein
MRKYKILIFLACLSICSLIQAQPVQISDFNELMKTLNSGEKVRMIVHYKQCKLVIAGKEEKSSPEAVSGLDISTFEYFAPGAANNKMAFVVFSETKLIKNPIGKGYVYNYGKVRVNSDNSVKISAQYLNAKNFRVMMDETFEGVINDGKNGGGIFLFK